MLGNIILTMINITIESNFQPIDFESEIETIFSVLTSIEINLKSNYRLLLVETTLFERQLKVLCAELCECEYRLMFLTKATRKDKDLQTKLDLIKDSILDVRREIDIFMNIYTLRKVELDCNQKITRKK
jgi:hypothetical protein